MMDYGVILPVILLIISVVMTFLLAKVIRIAVVISRFQGPRAYPIIGNAFDYKSGQREFFVNMQSTLNEYRAKTSGLMRMWAGPYPVLIIYGAKHMEVILSSTRHIKKGYTYKFLEPWLGLGLLTSTGQKWFHRRKLLTPTFHFSILKSFVEVFNEHTAILAKKLEQYADTSETINIFPMVTHCVLDIICETAMGHATNAQENDGNEYVKAVKRMGELTAARLKNPAHWPDFMFAKMEAGKEHDVMLKILHDATNEMIEKRLKEPPRISEMEDDDDAMVTSRRKRIAFLDLLLKMHRDDESFTLEDIREEVDTFMFEGHDTTAAAISWAILLLGYHLDIQARLHDELDQVFGESSRSVTSDDLSRLPYLTCIVKESLRIIPAVPMVARSLEEDIVLDDKVVPKEALIVLSIYALHHDPEQFPDPYRFDPDRFLPENVEKRHPYAYVPFSAGSRNCIGQRFAMMEVKLTLANIFRRFSIKSLQTIDEAKPAGQLVTRPVEGNMLVKLSHRK